LQRDWHHDQGSVTGGTRAGVWRRTLSDRLRASMRGSARAGEGDWVGQVAKPPFRGHIPEWCEAPVLRSKQGGHSVFAENCLWVFGRGPGTPGQGQPPGLCQAGLGPWQGSVDWINPSRLDSSQWKRHYPLGGARVRGVGHSVRWWD